MSEDWSRTEVEAIVADYLIMFEHELNGLSFNKAEHNRQLAALLHNRSRGAVEFKYANISAALIDLDYPYIKGYQPRSNYQDLLLEVVAERMDENVSLKAAVLHAVEKRAHYSLATTTTRAFWFRLPSENAIAKRGWNVVNLFDGCDATSTTWRSRQETQHSVRLEKSLSRIWSTVASGA